MGVICSRAIFFELCNTFNLVPRSSLMTGGAKRGAPNPWLFEEPEETRGLGFDEIRQQQQKIIQGTDCPRTVGSGASSGSYGSLDSLRGRTIRLLKPLAVLCLRTPEERTNDVIHESVTPEVVTPPGREWRAALRLVSLMRRHVPLFHNWKFIHQTQSPSFPY